jgi:hypothetical protein
MLSACGDDPNRIKAKDEVDLDALRTTLVNEHLVQTAIDMNEWYDVTVESCNRDEQGWRMSVAQEFGQGYSSNDAIRTSMEAICPGRAHMVDDAIKAVQGSSRDADLACSLAPNQRTSQQQQLAETLGCD